jgi:serine/threonine-protein kinase SRPK3
MSTSKTTDLVTSTLVVIGDAFAQGHYRVVHKLNFGGSLTNWLARNLNRPRKLVTLKVMHAEVSSKPLDEIPKLFVLLKLSE